MFLPDPVVIAILGMVASVAAVRLAGARSAETLKRGSRVQSQLPRRLVRFAFAGRADLLRIGGVPIALADETKHFKMVGATGSGKSTAIRELLAGALGRGDRAIVADPDGGYRSAFFRRARGDVALNPFDGDSPMWDPLSEIETRSDVDHLSAGLIPTGADAAANEWRGYARTFLSAVLLRSRFDRPCSCAELWRLLAVASVGELRELLAGTPAQTFVDEENARMFASIRAVAVSALAALPYIGEQRAAAFSIRRWVGCGRPGGVLFLPYRAREIAALRSLIATWMRLAIFEALSRQEEVDQRLWFVVDELDALGAIEGLKDALARLRKFGGRCVLGVQSIGQVSGAYGTADAQTIVENCGNTLILRCGGSENGGTSQFASRLIGEREIRRRQVSRGSDRESSLSARGRRRSTNVSDQHVTEPAVLASEIEQLADLHGFLKTASSREWMRVRLSRGAAR